MPQRTALGGVHQVDEHLALVQQGEDNTIYWSLPAGGTYFFPNTNQNPGIKFDSPPPARLTRFREKFDALQRYGVERFLKD